MLIVPAIDLRGGACVRLMNGRFDAVVDYGDPAARLAAFEAAGASFVHIVDLDGAERGAPVQHDLVGALTRTTNIKVQCGGGVRSERDIEALLEHGVARVVVGSIAVQDPKRTRAWLNGFGRERLCLALDVRRVSGFWEVLTNGWTAGSGATLEGALDFFGEEDVRYVLVTDVSRDGALKGPSLGLIAHLAGAYPFVRFQASGGVAKLTDLKALREAGANAAIIGRALYEKRFTLEDALAL